MDNEKAELVICLGSSCFARGNNKTLQAISTFLKDHDLEEKVFFHGSHCFGFCTEGPILKINGKFFKNVNEMNVIDILTEEFNI